MKLKESARLWKEALRIFPGGVNSPVRAFRSVGGNPIFIDRGKGAYVQDADGNWYLDFLSSWGPLILGHAPPSVVRATENALKKGSSFGTTTAAEVKLGDFILSQIPHLERIRFVSSGTEAVMTALRLARGVTGRAKVIKFEGCYHGHSDSLLARAGSGLLTLTGNIAESSSPGVPQEIVQNTLVLPLDDSNALEALLKQHGESIACIIIEPVPANAGLLIQRRVFIEHLLSLAKQYGILVIFDEVISGFRLGFSGYAGREKFMPDLVTYGKIIGGGLPVGAIAGKEKIMDALAPQGSIYQAGTLSGNPLAMAAGYETLKELSASKGAAYTRLTKLARHLEELFLTEITPLFTERDWAIRLVEEESLFWFSFHKPGDTTPVRRVDKIESFSARLYKHIFNAMIERGVYLAPSAYEVGFLNTAMRKRDIEHFIEALQKSIRKLPKNERTMA